MGISGLVTFIAAYHYIRIFNSWVDAYSYEGVPQGEGPKLTGVPFNDAYRYMDWLLTVPLLLIEILLVMKLEADDFNSRAWTLGFGSALMIVSGYYGELVVTGDLTPRWVCWFLSMSFFLYIVYELLVGLAAATKSEENPMIAGKIGTAQVMTCISWCTYPIVYLFPMFHFNPAKSVVASNWATAFPTLSLSAAWGLSSTKFLMPNPKRSERYFCDMLGVSFISCSRVSAS